MRALFFIFTLLFSIFSFAQTGSIKEPKPKYSEDIAKEEKKLSKQEKLKLKKWRTPTKPKSAQKGVKPDSTENIEQQIKETDQSDLSQPE